MVPPIPWQMASSHPEPGPDVPHLRTIWLEIVLGTLHHESPLRRNSNLVADLAQMLGERAPSRGWTCRSAGAPSRRWQEIRSIAGEPASPSFWESFSSPISAACARSARHKHHSCKVACSKIAKQALFQLAAWLMRRTCPTRLLSASPHSHLYAQTQAARRGHLSATIGAHPRRSPIPLIVGCLRGRGHDRDGLWPHAV